MGRPARFARWLSVFIFCFLFWLLLTWSVAPRELFWGAIISAVVSGFTARFFIHARPFWLYHPKRLLMLLIYCVAIFPWELIKANLSMAKLVLDPKLGDYQAGILRVPGSKRIRSTYGLAMVSNSITLTPGTITMDVAEDEAGDIWYYIHWIDVAETDREKAGEAIKGRMERWIGRIWQ